jgi:hypothetical protein
MDPAESELKGGDLNFKGLSQDGDGPIFMRTYEMNLLSARSILLDSTFNGLFVIMLPV